EKLRKAEVTFEDFLEQLEAMRRMGPLGDLLKMVPGMQQLAKEIPEEATEQGLKVTRAIIQSMTREERRNPKIINASRKRRIARGSGTSVQQVNQLLRQFLQMQQMMKQMQGGRGRRALMPWLR
ncbi:MAG: signal recognition particle protein, partial [Chloroflexi bacterium]|nr:signal recognition particle protein [Chloroflexota bacterium]